MKHLKKVTIGGQEFWAELGPNEEIREWWLLTKKEGQPPAPEMPRVPLRRCPGCGCDKPSDHDCEPAMVRLHSLEMRVCGLEEREDQ